MIVAVSLLRGVNVGGHNKVPMAPLKTLYESLGFKDVRTYVQSGNVVFRAPGRDITAVAPKIEAGIERAFGFRCAVIIRTAEELKGVVERNPFQGRDDIEPSRLLISFLAGDPDAGARNKFLAINVGPEELRIENRELYIHYPTGLGRSKLTPALLEKALGMTGTARNWNTVTKLLEMAEDR
jgi:uncharacterized protein (DUF1697 family)